MFLCLKLQNQSMMSSEDLLYMVRSLLYGRHEIPILGAWTLDKSSRFCVVPMEAWNWVVWSPSHLSSETSRFRATTHSRAEVGKTKPAKPNYTHGKAFEALQRQGLLCLCWPNPSVVPQWGHQGQYDPGDRCRESADTYPPPAAVTDVLCGLHLFNWLFCPRYTDHNVSS